MLNMFRQLLEHAVLPALLLLFLSGVDSADTHAMQSDSVDGFAEFSSALAYDDQKQELRLLGNVAVSDDATRCSYKTVHMSNFSITSQIMFGKDNEVCHNLVIDDDSRTYMVGHSYPKGGTLAPLEANLGFLALANSIYYGMVVDMGQTGESGPQGGRIVFGNRYVYPMAVASQADTVYTASLYSGTSVAETNGSGNMENPSQVLPDGENFALLIEAYNKKTNYTPDVSEDGTIGSAAFDDDLVWDKAIAPENNAGIHNIAGIVPLSDSLLVAGSTNGYGSGLGIASSVNSSMDGFVVKLSLDGALDGSHSYRVQSPSEDDEYIHGICRGESDEIVYLTGSTKGRLTEGAENDGKQRAFIVKLNVTSMKEEWVFERAAHHHDDSAAIETPAEGIACVTSNHGHYVYMAGNVHGGGTMQSKSETRALSLGGSDVFVAKFHTTQGTESDAEWIRQLGSTGDERLAPRGGMAFMEGQGVVIYGQTNGDLYRVRGNETTPAVLDFFVSVINQDGDIPDQIQEQTIASATPTSPPSTSSPSTSIPSTEAPTTVLPGCTSPNCESYSILLQSVKLRIEGIGAFNDKAGAALAATMKKWYEDYYSVNTESRRLKKDKIHRFQTDIGYWGHSVGDGGSLITYNQTVAFDSDHENVGYDFAAALIIDPLLDNTNKLDLLQAISESDEAFRDATAISEVPEVPDEDRPRNAAGQTNFNVFIWIGASLFGVCICWGVYTAKHIDKKDKTEDYDEKNDIDQPEAPLDLDMA